MLTSHAYCTEEIISYYSIWFPLLTSSNLFEEQLIFTGFGFGSLKKKWSFFDVALSPLLFTSEKTKGTLKT